METRNISRKEKDKESDSGKDSERIPEREGRKWSFFQNNFQDVE